MIPPKYSHNHSGGAPSCCNHNPGSCSTPPWVQRENHSGQFFPLLTHNITCSFLCTPCSLLQSLRSFCGAREEVWRIQSLFFRHNSRLRLSGVTWVSWRVWAQYPHFKTPTRSAQWDSCPSKQGCCFRPCPLLFWHSEVLAQMEESTFQVWQSPSLLVSCASSAPAALTQCVCLGEPAQKQPRTF